ncbi:unnamed protein product [Meloidogyne enterolobii]|uniref:Uncharacterized protein n=1 Tax=Meloidogyne enterolobii TaxID=390850 RepID=A0ACB1A7K7_MELEN
METGRCNYGERCQYAHGDREKRPVPRHPKYKTEPCQSYHKTGYCPYGPRCHFIHNENPTQLKALINANEQALRIVQDIATAGPDSKQRTILTTSCSAASLGAYAAMQSATNNNSTGTPPIFSSGKMTNTSSGVYPAQRSNSAIVAYLNGQQHLIGKSHNFGSNPDNFNIFNNNNNNSMHLLQNSPPQEFDQQQQNCHQFSSNFYFDEFNTGMKNYSEGNNNLKSLWHETPRDNEFLQNNSNLSGMMADNQNFRPKTLDLFSPPAVGGGWHSEQISPLHFSSIPYTHGVESTQILQQNRRQRKILPVPVNTQKQHFLDFTDDIDSVGNNNNEELDAQQLLGNLCCASDDEYSRSSIISSNIDSGNESPPAASEDSAKPKASSQAVPIHQQLNNLSSNSQQSSALSSLDETQQRRSSDGDKTITTTTPNSLKKGATSKTVEGVDSTDINTCNKSTASSSLASLLSSSSSNSATHIQKTGDSILINSKDTSSPSLLPPTPTTATKAESSTEKKDTSPASVRLPVFERLSLNQ